MAWVVQTEEDLALRVTLRADATGRGLSTVVFIPAVVLDGRVPAAIPSSANSFQPLMASSVLAGASIPQNLQAEVTQRLAQMTPEERQQIEAMMGENLQEMLGSTMEALGEGPAGTADGFIELSGPPQDQESVTYYLMTVASFEMDPSNRDSSGESGRQGQGWNAQGAASVVARLERVDGTGSSPAPVLPGLQQVKTMMGVIR
jgi:hypothetical protein